MKDSDLIYVKRAETWSLIKAYLGTLVLLSRAVYMVPNAQRFFNRVQDFINEMEAEFPEAL